MSSFEQMDHITQTLGDMNFGFESFKTRFTKFSSNNKASCLNDIHICSDDNVL